MGEDPVLPDKLADKTIGELATAAAGRRTRRTVALKYGNGILIEVTVNIPVIFPDPADILTGLEQSRGGFKDWNNLTCPGIEP